MRCSMLISIKNVLTKYEDVIVHWSSSQSSSSRGQWCSQSPGPGHVLQNFGGVLSINSTVSSSDEEHLHDNDPLFTDIWYRTHVVSLISEVTTTGMTMPSNIELRQSFSLSSPAVSGHSLQRTVWWGLVIASSDDKLVLCFNPTGRTV